MSTPFPGMDPYLEHPDLWQAVHSRLIVALADYLAPHLRPRYYVDVELRTYRAGLTGLTFVGRPDVSVVASPRPTYRTAPTARTAPMGIVTVELPVPDIVRETYLEVCTTEGGQVITSLEILSPANKLPGEGRVQYERERTAVLDSLTHLVEVDLLRGGQPMVMFGDGHGAHLRHRVFRVQERQTGAYSLGA